MENLQKYLPVIIPVGFVVIYIVRLLYLYNKNGGKKIVTNLSFAREDCTISSVENKYSHPWRVVDVAGENITMQHGETKRKFSILCFKKNHRDKVMTGNYYGIDCNWLLFGHHFLLQN